MGAKLKSKTHLQNTFFDFLSRFLRVWLQSLKKVLIWPKHFFPHISVTFLLITFFLCIFQNFFNGFEISVKFFVFWYPYWFLTKKFFFSCYHFLYTLIANAQETAQKNGKSFFMNVSSNLVMQPSKGLHNQVVKIVVPYTVLRPSHISLRNVSIYTRAGTQKSCTVSQLVCAFSNPV